MARCELIIRGGWIYDGSGSESFIGDIAVGDGRILAVGDVGTLRGREELVATELAVAPGFINVLSWATESIIEDGRCQSDIRQGVTMEVFGEGESMGPLSEALKDELVERQQGIHYSIEWTTLGEYLDYIQSRGVAPNVASFAGATTIRAHVIGYDDRPPTNAEMERMQMLVRHAMAEGALGVGAALIYAPGCYAATDELVELARVAAEFDGMFICHLRSEADRLLEAIDELIQIAGRADVRAEIYHLKAAGRSNWHKLDEAIERIEAARARGVAITADMYPYTAAATGLDASMPPWVQEGGFFAWRERLREPAARARVEQEMTAPNGNWENFFRAAGPENMRFVRFRSESLRQLTGRTLAEAAAGLGMSPAQAAMHLVIEDNSRIETAYFLMSEANVRKQVALPWMSFASDAMAVAPEGVFLDWTPHPRTYGTFARVLGKYVRDDAVIPLEEAIRRLTSLPAANLRLRDRGRLAPGKAADIVVFDQAAVRDLATYDDPHRYAIGVVDVLVNGTPVLRDGEHTGALPGRVVRGPGWKPDAD